MARKLLRTGGKRKITPKKQAVETPFGIVVVGNYKTRQLDWIRRNGVYNWPVRDGDEFSPEQFARINELWLYANVKSERHVFSAAFVGKMSAAEFRAAYPTYAKLGASKQKAYYVFKAKSVDYPPELGSQVVLARAADFGGYSAKVKKAVEQFKRDGEFAPLAAYLPKELAKVPRPQLCVCEAAVQFACSSWSPVREMTPQYEKIENIVLSINTFSRKNDIPSGEAFKYLETRGGLSYLDEGYEDSRCFSLEAIVEDVERICRRNGGTL